MGTTARHVAASKGLNNYLESWSCEPNPRKAPFRVLHAGFLGFCVLDC